MKDLELAVLGVEEMNETELQNTDGGLIPVLVACIIGSIGAGFYFGWERGRELAEKY